jgi:cell division protein YceG involved in septum cleavage
VVTKAIRAVLLTAVIILPAASGWLVRELRTTGPRSGEPVLVEIERGWSARAVLERLSRAGLVRSALALRLACRAFYPGESF